MPETAEYTGRLIEFLSSGELKIARVTRQAKDKLQVTDRNGKQHRVALKNLVVAHAGTVEPDEFATRADALVEQIESVRDDVDSELLWESLQDEIRDYDVVELAGEYFGDASPARVSAIFRAVLDDTIRFRFRSRIVTPRTPQQVEDQLVAMRRREEKRARRERACRWFSEILSRETNGTREAVEVPEEMEPLLDRLLAVVRGQGDDVSTWIAELRRGMPPRQIAFDILVGAGRLPPDADPRVVFAGVRFAFPSNVRKEADEAEPFTANDASSGGAREDLTAFSAFAIDDEDTDEVDDAVTFEDLPGGGARVGVHIADVACFLEKDCAQDREAALRGATLYLPYRRVPMLPERTSCDLASLVPGALRPCVSVIAEFGPGGELRDWKLRRGVLRVARRLTYDEADAAINGHETTLDPALARSLLRLHELTRRLEAERQSRGALTLRRPEIKIVARDGDLTLKVIDGSSPSRLVVSELMVLCNRLAAEFACEEQIPIIFRAQDRPDGEVEQPDHYDPVALDQIFRKLSRSKMSLTRQAHAGLGLDAYTQLTSPLRRYQDLVMQRQLTARLADRPLPYESQELLEALASAQGAESDNRDIENEANREYTLRWVERNLLDDDHEAIVLGTLSGGYLAELRSLPVRGKLLAPQGIEIGTVVPARIKSVQPENGSMILESRE